MFGHFGSVIIIHHKTYAATLYRKQAEIVIQKEKKKDNSSVFELMLALDQNHCSPNESLFNLWLHNYYTGAGISQTFNMFLTVVSKIWISGTQTLV